MGNCDHNWPLPWDRGEKRLERSIREESKNEQELASLKRKEQMLCQSAADRQRSETCAERYILGVAEGSLYSLRLDLTEEIVRATYIFLP